MSNSENSVPHPPIASAADWLKQRLDLLEQEKEHTRQMDLVNAARRRLPMVKLEKSYTFDGPRGRASLLDLFEGRRQLIVYHFMFDPQWTKGCNGCTGYVDALGDLSMLSERNTSFSLISRAPLAKLEAYKAARGWKWPWYSSFGSPFNYDFNVTHDEKVAPEIYNYRAEEPKKESAEHKGPRESHGLSVFFRLGDDVHHTYSTYARGVENLVNSYALLDVTPYGRQEDFEDSPKGWPQKPTYG